LSPPATSIAKSSPPLRVDTLVKRFGEITALDGITLELHSGECLGLLGPNGAGKSTLIRSIVGRVIPDAGTISVFGAQADSMSARTALGWVPQELALYPRLTCRENLQSFGRYHGLGGVALVRRQPLASPKRTLSSGREVGRHRELHLSTPAELHHLRRD
jgi:linearmycin/streptolysin S transport system ATP-binding protein